MDKIKARDDLVKIFHFEFQSPLSLIKGYSEILINQYSQPHLMNNL